MRGVYSYKDRRRCDVKKPADFFRLAQPHSSVKSDIVAKYFGAWLHIIKKQTGTLTYLDLFSGRGYYEDGTPSTPIKILDKINEQPDVYDRLKVHFYEKDNELRVHLNNYVKQHSVFSKLRFKPTVHPDEINRSLVEALPANKMTFSFIDPCGYQNLSVELLAAVVKNWGSDCLFYLSTSGIRRNIDKKHQRDFMVEIFNEGGLERLEDGLATQGSLIQRDSLILKELNSNLNRHVKIYMISFAMEYEQNQSTSHYLVFICKHSKGFELMKDIMSVYSLKDASDIPLWIYSTLKSDVPVQGELFNDRMQSLKKDVLQDFRGQRLQVGIVVEHCHILKYLYTEKNIKAALMELENTNELTIDKPRERRQRRNGRLTLGNNHIVSFNK